MEIATEELQATRERFAEELRVASELRSIAVVRAFSEVPREDYLGPGPWSMWHPYRRDYWTTPDADPRHLYHNVIVAIDRARKLNNGMPSALAYMIEALELSSGEHIVHLGCGVGYYTAVLAHVVGEGGRVTAVETDQDLAGRASANLAGWKQVSEKAADGCTFEFDEADALPGKRRRYPSGGLLAPEASSRRQDGPSPDGEKGWWRGDEIQEIGIRFTRGVSSSHSYLPLHRR